MSRSFSDGCHDVSPSEKKPAGSGRYQSLQSGIDSKASEAQPDQVHVRLNLGFTVKGREDSHHRNVALSGESGCTRANPVFVRIQCSLQAASTRERHTQSVISQHCRSARPRPHGADCPVGWKGGGAACTCRRSHSRSIVTSSRPRGRGRVSQIDVRPD